jgi:hypothetical protein
VLLSLSVFVLLAPYLKGAAWANIGWVMLVRVLTQQRTLNPPPLSIEALSEISIGMSIGARGVYSGRERSPTGLDTDWAAPCSP